MRTSDVLTCDSVCGGIDAVRACANAEMTPTTPPTSNTGGLVSEAYTTYVMVNGEVKEIPLKRGFSTSAFIDTLSISFPEDAFIRPDQLGTDEEIACNASAEFEQIMGYGLSTEKNGRNGYAKSFLFGDEKENYGFFACGGARQNGTVFVYFTGVGLTAALDGWETRLYDFIINRAPTAKITRIDLAHDFLSGEYTPDKALSEWEQGLYTSSHTKPIAECVGGDWLHYVGTGKTLYIGSRKNASRFVRVYEKGKQLGDRESNWVRVELEMRNRDIVIPYDVLINSGEYLTGAYPAFQQLFAKYKESPKKTERIQKQKDITIEHVLKYASLQSAASIVMMEEMGMTDTEIKNALKNNHKKLPKRLSKAAFDCKELVIKYIHEFGRLPETFDQILSKFSNSLKPLKPRYRHRTMTEFVNDYQKAKTDFSCKKRSYIEYIYDRFATPYYLLNAKFVQEIKYESAIIKS